MTAHSSAGTDKSSSGRISLLIRKAEREDAPALFQLILALADYEKLDPPDDSAFTRMAEDLWGARPRAEAWLGVSDGEPVAYAFAFETYSTFLARPTLYLEDLFVLPAFRAKGVGRAIFRHLAGEAVRRGCGRMDWTCLDWNVPALRFYEAIGARRMDEWVSFRLETEQLERVAVGGD